MARYPPSRWAIFVADVARLQRREDQHIGPALQRAAGRFVRSDVRYKGGVKLQLAIDHQLRRPLTHDLRGLLDVSHTGMPGAAGVEKDSIATRGASPAIACQVSALAIAISASCAAVGCGTTLQSANPSGCPVYCGSIRNSEESVLHPGCRPIRRRPARSTLAVDERDFRRYTPRPARR